MEKLIFVYNADSGKLNNLLGSLHKTVKPSSYSCKLCRLTYGVFDEKRSWKKFRESLELETEFFHKNEFQKLYASKFGYKFEFPLILIQNSRGLEIFLSKDEFSGIDSLEELMEVISDRLKTA
ncbi:GTPase [Christiangramia crocea]|uniref:GTPase n=1 Tax=Christiangramia crocea TaxID=2904124 RepID=A0A9X2A3W3_9FLAO|nr:GTPase [Gramella crocea]MCG9970199.1 GTPase [Gramella crocea]